MTEPRKRTRNGSAREASFYCRYGNHYLVPIYFENGADNRGVCMSCAFEIYELLRAVIFVPEINPAARMKAVADWQSGKAEKVTVDRIRQGSKDPGWVYYVAQDNLIKIGYAKDVKKRIKAYGPTAQLLAVHPGTPDLEKVMHKKFSGSLDAGREWFRRDESLLEHIADIRERFGDLTVFEYKYTKPKTQEEKVRAAMATRAFIGVADGAHSIV